MCTAGTEAGEVIRQIMYKLFIDCLVDRGGPKEVTELTDSWAW